MNFGKENKHSVGLWMKFKGIVLSKEQNIGIYGYIGTWILRKYRKISVDILTKISVMQKLTKIL